MSWVGVNYDSEFKQAIENDGLQLQYQPKIGTQTQRIKGVEALGHWIHPEQGFIPPDRVIPTAEQTGPSKLDTMGVSLSIDDFGTGYSSLAYLKRLPVDELKIDRSFVMEMDAEINDEVIVRPTIDLAHNMGLRVIPEGIETPTVWDKLAEMGCDMGQGYFMGRPQPAEALGDWLAESIWGLNNDNTNHE